MLKLYHGSNIVIDNIDLSYSKRGKDFGCGFYLNPDKTQAMEMAVRTTQRLQEGKPVLNTYLFDDNLIRAVHSPLSVKVFDESLKLLKSVIFTCQSSVIVSDSDGLSVGFRVRSAFGVSAVFVRLLFSL